jgi:hypothetical protein
MTNVLEQAAKSASRKPQLVGFYQPVADDDDDARLRDCMPQDVVLRDALFHFFEDYERKCAFSQAMTMNSFRIPRRYSWLVADPIDWWQNVLRCRALSLSDVTMEVACDTPLAERLMPGVNKDWHRIDVAFRAGATLDGRGTVFFSSNPHHMARFRLYDVDAAKMLAYIVKDFEAPLFSMIALFPQDTLAGDTRLRNRCASLGPAFQSFVLQPGKVVKYGNATIEVSEASYLMIFRGRMQQLTSIDYQMAKCQDRSKIVAFYGRPDKQLLFAANTPSPHTFTTTHWFPSATIRWPATSERMAEAAVVLLHMNIGGARVVELPVYVAMWILDFLPEFGRFGDLLKVKCIERARTSVRDAMERMEKALNVAGRTRQQTQPPGAKRRRIKS